MPTEAVANPVAGAPAAAAAPSGGEGRSLLPPPTSGAPAGQGAPVAGTVAEIYWKGLVREDGTLDKTRFNHLPADRKEDAAILSRYPNLDEAMKGLAHHARTAREKGLTPLREGATPDEIADHTKRLALVNGAPDKPEGYGIKHDNPEVQKQYDAFAQVFHKHVLTPAAVQELVALNEKLQTEQVEAFNNERARAEDEQWGIYERILKRDFGAFANEKWAAVRAGSRWAGIDLDAEPIKKALESLPGELRANLMAGFAKVGEKIGEAKFVDGQSAATGAQEPEAEMADMVNNPANKYYDVLRNPSKNPRLHAEAFARQRRLGELIAAKQAKAGG